MVSVRVAFPPYIQISTSCSGCCTASEQTWKSVEADILSGKTNTNEAAHALGQDLHFIVIHSTENGGWSVGSDGSRILVCSLEDIYESGQ